MKCVTFGFARVAQAMHFTLAKTCAFVYAPPVERQNNLVGCGHLRQYFGRGFAPNYAVAVYASKIVE